MVILIVDTVQLVLRNLDRILSGYGYEVITADSGKSALEIIKRDHRVKLVITDLKISGMTAIELFKASRDVERVSDEGGSNPPEFVMLTSERPDRDVNSENVKLLQEALDLGFIDILFKPLVRAKLMQHVQSVGSPLPDNPSQSNTHIYDRASEAASSFQQQIQRLDEKHTSMERRLDDFEESQINLQNELAHIKAILVDMTTNVD